MLTTFWRDLRYAGRAFVKYPAFSFIAVVSIAVGVGANAAAFSIADGILLRPLAVPRASEVVTLTARTPDGRLSNAAFSYPDYIDLQARARSFDGLVALTGLTASVTIDRNAAAQARFGYAVSANMFDALGVRAAIGRTFLATEDQVPGRDPVLVLAHDMWAQQFASDANVVGRTVRIGRIDFTIVGVLPEVFDGVNPYLHPSFYLPLTMTPSLGGASGVPINSLLENRGLRTLRVIGRLAPGVSLAQASEEVALIATRLEREHGDTNRRRGILVQTELGARATEYRPAMQLAVLLAVLAVLVLVVACANLSGLLASRAPARAREIAIRLSIGGTRARVVRQLVTETLAVALAGAALGMVIAYGGVAVFRQFQLVSDVGVRFAYVLDRRALAIGIVLAVLIAIVASLVPAWRAGSARDLTSTLRGTVGHDATRRGMWGRQGLVSVQVALSMVLVTLGLVLRCVSRAACSRPRISYLASRAPRVGSFACRVRSIAHRCGVPRAETANPRDARSAWGIAHDVRASQPGCLWPWRNRAGRHRSAWRRRKRCRGDRTNRRRFLRDRCHPTGAGPRFSNRRYGRRAARRRDQRASCPAVLARHRSDRETYPPRRCWRRVG